jgi:fibronectin type 3 domain-containing protein
MVRLRRALAGMAAAVAPIAAVVAPGFVSTAHALTPGVGFTADPLPTYQTNGIAWSVAETGGVAYIGGTFSSVRPSGTAAGTTADVPASNFVALNAASGERAACQPSFTGTGASVRALAVSPDQTTLYAAGLFSAVNGTPVSNVAAIDLASCSVVPGFRPTVSSWVRDLTVASNGNVYIAGEFTTVSGQTRQHFAAFSPNSALLPWAPATDLDGYTVAITSDGKNAAIGGAFDFVNGSDSHALAIVNADTGANVRTYPNHFVPVNSTVKSLKADSTGIYSGNEGTGGGVFDGRIALDPLNFNQRWRDTCLGATQDVLLDGGNLYGANHAHDCSSMGGFPNGRRQHLTVEPTNDPHLKVWWPDTNDGLGEGIGPRSLAISSSGGRRYFFAVGEFTSVNGVAQQGIMRLADGPDTGAPPAVSGLTASTAVAGQVRLRWLTSSDRDDETLTYKVYRDSSTVPVATINANSDWWRRPQVTYTDTNVVPGQLYIYKVTATDSAGNVSSAPTLGVRPSSTSSQYAAAVLADNPYLYWRYNETAGSTLSDDSTGGNGAFLVGTRTPAATPAALTSDGTAMTFDGATGYAYQAQPAVSAPAFTVETWFKTTTLKGGKIVGFGNNTTRLSGNYDRHIYMLNSGQLAFGVFTNVANTLTSASTYNDGQWHHVVGSQGTGGMVLYVDGVKVASNTVTTVRNYLGYWRVGGDQLNNWPSRPASDFFAGSIDETAVYPTQLAAGHVVAHYQASGRTPAADTTPPSTPTGLTATASGSNVALKWTASTDNVGVAGYTVHRSSTTGFTPSTTTKVADVTGTTYTDTARPAGTWYYRIVARDAAGNTSGASTQASATVAASGDTTAPTAPTGLTATASGSNVALKWTASTDNVGVAGYTVHRSSTTGFTPSTTTKVADVTGTTYTDTARPAGTWYYRVVARDAAGNASAASAQASATVAGTATTVTQTVVPSADTYVNSGASTTNYGTSSSLSSSGTGVVSYLRFPLPAVPAGKVLKSASLRIQTTSLASAGSADSHPVNLGPSGWTETGLTWGNRPAAPSPATQVGSITGATAVSAQKSATLTASAIAPFAGKDLNLTVRDSGTDSLWFWSRSVTTASQRPTLTLVYGAP